MTQTSKQFVRKLNKEIEGDWLRPLLHKAIKHNLVSEPKYRTLVTLRLMELKRRVHRSLKRRRMQSA